MQSKIELIKTIPDAPKITQSRIKRDWMDGTYNKHAYQCAPVTTANVAGWELSLDSDVRVVWPGGNTNVQILSGSSKFASATILGMVSFTIGWRFKTPNGYSLSIGGSPNFFFHGAYPVSAIIPTAWWPDEFQMNWVITEPNREIVFPAGFPFMFFTLVKLEELENFELAYSAQPDDIEFSRSRQRYAALKQRQNKEKPWTWVKGIKTGIDADGQRIGPGIAGLPRLHEPK